MLLHRVFPGPDQKHSFRMKLPFGRRCHRHCDVHLPCQDTGDRARALSSEQRDKAYARWWHGRGSHRVCFRRDKVKRTGQYKKKMRDLQTAQDDFGLPIFRAKRHSKPRCRWDRYWRQREQIELIQQKFLKEPYNVKGS